MPVKKKAQPTFEAGLEKLEALAAGMEDGSMPLEQALSAYEEGMALYKELSGMLEGAQLRIEQIQAGAKDERKPFEVDA